MEEGNRQIEEQRTVGLGATVFRIAIAVLERLLAQAPMDWGCNVVSIG